MRQRGFTLMELIIAMTIVGILTAIAIPSYTAYIQRAARAEARAHLLEAAVWAERQRVQFGRFDNALAPGTQTLPVGLQCSPRNTTGTGTCTDYDINFEAVAAATFTLRAVPVAGGRMAADECGTFRIDETARRTHSGAGTVAACLNR
jgi:type IV pilus assembly protein PilE